MADTNERKAFKDYFDRSAARALGAQVKAAHRGFDERAFVRQASRGLDALEFQGRVQQFSDALSVALPDSIPKALRVLVKSLPDPLPDCEAVTDGWLQWPVGQFIADHGVPHFDASMDAMMELTQRFSSEFAVRPFVDQRPKETFAKLLGWVEHDSPHVRRWCSEGTRPRLPWGKKLRALVEDPSPILPIVDALKDDPELYVRRSVANNLNDVAKDHPQLVIKRCRAWSKGSNPGRDGVIKHALRTLIKDGDARALAVVGYTKPTRLETTLSVGPKAVKVGGQVALKAILHNKAKKHQRLLVDYVVHFVRKAGQTSAKVFKWKQVELNGGASCELTKAHGLKETTIRALYPGVHRVELQVNGHRLAQAQFRLRS